MADLTFILGDDAPSVYGTLTDSTGTPLNLTGATVHFQMRNTLDRRFAVDAAAAIVSAPAGTVRYDWDPADLNEAGNFVSRWAITLSGGSVEHSDPGNSITVSAA